MTIRYAVGNATAPAERPAIIAHVVNTEGRWGAGFVLAVSRRWPQPERVYREHHRTVGLLLGTVHAVEVEPGLWVANMVAQCGTRSFTNPVPLRYNALHQCLEQVAAAAKRAGATVAMPRIGCGLGGGTWAHVEPIVAEACAGVPVVVYDLPPQVAPR